jgi:hypothetical protein
VQSRHKKCIMVWERTALHLVGSTAARVALHRSARNRGYKLSREGIDPRSLRGKWVSVVYGSLFRSVIVNPSPPREVSRASPFIVSKGLVRVTFVVKR